MTTALNRKLSRRHGLRAVLNTTIKTVEDYIKGDDLDQVKLIGYKKTLLNVVQQLEVANEEVLKSLEPEFVEADVVESFQVIAPVNELEASIDLKFGEINLKESQGTPSNSPSIVRSSTVVSCRLPKMDIPIFKGDPLLWQGFWDQFQVTIHDNESLGDIDRFNYLKRFLGGEALRSVSGLRLSCKNYNEAIAILKERYGNEQVLISAHMEALLKVPKIRHKDDLKGLRKLYNDIENCIRNLRTLNLETAAYGSLLIPMLKEKLPDELLISISRKFGSDLWNLDILLKHFNDELRAYENCIPATKVKTIAEADRKSGAYTTSGMLVHHQDKPPCLFCQKLGHAPSQCRIVTNVRARKEIVIKKGRCFICLGSGHLAKYCSSNYSCRKCKGRHNISICVFEQKKEGNHRNYENKVVKSDINGEGDNENSVHTTHVQAEMGVLLQTAQGLVSNIQEDNSSSVRILFDTGSQRTYISEDLCFHLKLKTMRTERVIIKTFGNESSTVKNLRVVEFKVKHKFRNDFVVCEALCIPTVCCPVSMQNIDFAKKSFDHIRHLQLADKNDGFLGSVIDILVGADFYHQFFTGKVRKAETGPVACESILGWVLSGPLVMRTINSMQNCNLVETHLLRCVTESDNLRQDLARFWEIDSLGLEKTKFTDSDDVVNKFEKEIFHDGTRYVTKLPFKPNHDPLPDNYEVSKRRLLSTRRKLLSSGILDQYDKIFKDYEREGIIEKVSKDSVLKEVGSVHYLPHRAVVREDKDTTKIRAVFDASCAVNGPSLNDCLYSGPNLLGKIFDILIRFRLNEIAITADIRQAFLNIGIHPEHQDFLRFLWYDAGSDGELITYKFLRVVFGVTSSPFLLNGTIRQHLAKYGDHDGEFVKLFLEDLYVDDTASGCNSVREGKEFYNKATSIMAEAGFHLRKWSSNNKVLQRIFESQVLEGKNTEVETGDDCTFSESQLSQNKCSFSKVLGMEWDKESDQFVFNFKEFLENISSITLTKRNILSVSSSLYDPLGLISPITAWMKTIFQLLCKDNLDWDDEVPSNIKDNWLRFVGVVQSMEKIVVERFAYVSVSERIENVELHGFCDSSSEVYSAVVYLRVRTCNNVKVCLLTSKTKVAPIKSLSIPRLELLGCFLLSKLISEIKTALLQRINLDRIVCWTDSKVALSWIRGKEKSWKVWVENRVVKIREVVDREDWFHVSGKCNPADIPTRKLKGFEDLLQGCWFHGPSFLTDDEALKHLLSPISNVSEDTDDITSQIITEHVNLIQNDINQNKKTDCDKHVPSLSNIVEFKRFSSLKKLVHVIGYILRFTKNLKQTLADKKVELIKEHTITAEEYRNAKSLIIRDEQEHLRKREQFKNLKSSLNLFVDDFGLLRLKGRFGNSALSYQEKFPVLLRDSESYVTRLIVLDAHEKVLHHGVETTLAHIRNEFWIVKGRKTVKNIIRKCVTCIRYQGRTMLPPPSPDLPDFRISNLNAFQATGLDYCGPLFIRNKFCKADQKVYILLFTCATSRAIHLELTPDLQCDAFIRGFKRFISRRGTPTQVIHDNAKTFRSTLVKRYFATIGVTQKFILPASPWWGGFYERLVRTVKSALKKILKKSFVTYEELLTVLGEIESVINSRPLYYASEDDIEEVLTPNHLIFGRNLSRQTTVENSEIDAGELGKRLKHIKTILSHFWNRFTSSYLNELRQSNLYRKRKVNSVPKLQLQDVVLIKDDLPLPRTEWRIGKVENVVIGADGMQRGAKLRVLSKTGKRTVVHRPLQKLIPFEISEIKDDSPYEPGLPDKTHVVDQPERPEELVKSRVRRKAAIDGQYLRRLREQYN